MPAFIDITGHQYGRLIVIRRDTSRNRVHWYCHCTCGTKTIVDAASLKSGKTQSCGCLRVERGHDLYAEYGRAPSNKVDLLNQRFGMLIVTKDVGRTKDNQVRWRCLCDCGRETITQSGHLISGHTASCGCLKRRVIHGHARIGSNSLTYASWEAMIQRCCNPNATYYSYYGGRGITVCKRWRKFANFLVDMGERPPGLTLDRTNNARGYSKANCKWVTRKEQAANRRPKSRHSLSP
jgi:hypothetical protein